MEARIDSCPRRGISFLMGAEPLGNAPVNMTITNNAPANPPRANICQIYALNPEGNATPYHVTVTTANAIAAAPT